MSVLEEILADGLTTIREEGETGDARRVSTDAQSCLSSDDVPWSQHTLQGTKVPYLQMTR